MGLDELRREIDAIDDKLLDLFKRRMGVSRKIAEYKKENGLPVLDASREQEIMQRASAETDPHVAAFFDNILKLSKEYQTSLNSKYGLVGENLTYSYSKLIHESLGSYSYDLLSLDREGFSRLIEGRDFDGLNITNPYKQAVIAYCDEITQIAEKTGSVNTVYKKGGRLIGTNTDCEGFLYMLKRSGISLKDKKVLILGAGATSRTIRECAALAGAKEIVTAKRNHDFSKDRDAEIIINATPVGTFPDNGGRIIDISDFPGCSGVFDVVYNPLYTDLLLSAKDRGIPFSNGISMLVAQATAAAELFTGEGHASKNEEITGRLTSMVRNIVLIGMPGSGKTETGRKIAEITGREFVDLDEVVVRNAGISIPEIFARDGETAFRDMESLAAKEYGRRSRLVIATGGGVVLRKENMDALRGNAVVLFLDREIKKLATIGRPLSKDMKTLKKMYEERLPLYIKGSDYLIRSHSSLNIE